MSSNSAVVHALKVSLADSYLLYVKTHNFHWNVQGAHFQPLHALFEEQYTELAEAIDEIAERIRALGAYAPGAFSAFAELSDMGEVTKQLNAREMLEEMISSQKKLIANLDKGIATAAEHEDPASEDLFISRKSVHEKHLWMLQATAS